MNSIELATYLVNAAYDQVAHAERQLFGALREREKDGRRKPAECGTPSGYVKHRRADEIPCPACMAAHRWYETNRRRKAS